MDLKNDNIEQNNNGEFTLLENGESLTLSFLDKEKEKSKKSQEVSIDETSAASASAEPIAEKKEPIKISGNGSHTNEDFTLLYEKNLSNLVEGTIVKGRVILSTKDEVMIDIGAKAEGSVSADEFLEQPKVNDEVYVYIQKLEDKNGNLKLSHKIARTKLAMDNI
ncbi:MAG TPA: S1 RNA-binding domain-containing protein, partial [bacterium]|nr:S1 RNA-binding domain-containing protein [bacterium]